MVKILFALFVLLSILSFLVVLYYIHVGRFDAAVFFLVTFNMLSAGAANIYQQLKRFNDGRNA